MLSDEQHHLGQLDLLAHADDLGRQIRRQGLAAAGTLTRAVGHDLVGIGVERAAMSLVTRFGAAGLGLIAPLLAVRDGDLEEVREVLSGRCSRSTSLISSSLLRRSSSLRLIPEGK